MTARARQRPDLGGLQLLLLHLAESIDRAMVSARHVLLTRDVDEAARALAGDIVIDRLRADLEAEAHRLLAQHPAPLGEELRTVTAALVLGGELRRIGDCASRVVATAMGSAEASRLNVPAECNQMIYRAREILQGAMRAVIRRDPGAIERLRAVNESVDALYQHVRATLLTTMRANAELSEPATELLLIAHHLERMADCGIRIAERAAFIATGSWPSPGVGGRTAGAAREFARDGQVQ